MENDLIYDVGMHKGEDTDFYLKKGFRVVAIEAHAGFSEECKQKFRHEIDSGRLIIVNKAISDKPGMIEFFINENVSVWGTTNTEWVERNTDRGTKSYPVNIEATTIDELLRQFGMPYYMKIDIEGSDILCLSGLKDFKDRPKYVSVESSATSMKDTMAQLRVLDQLGYKKFKIVHQHGIEAQRCPKPAREGVYVDYQIQPGSSGLFGEEAPGEWLSLNRARLQYVWLHFQCRMMGPNNGIFRNLHDGKVKQLLNALFKNGGGWFDTHATF